MIHDASPAGSVLEVAGTVVRLQATPDSVWTLNTLQHRVVWMPIPAQYQIRIRAVTLICNETVNFVSDMTSHNIVYELDFRVIVGQLIVGRGISNTSASYNAARLVIEYRKIVH